MAWNNDPQIRDLATWAKKYNYNQVIAVVFTADGKFGYVSYGANAKLCKDAKNKGDKIYKQGLMGLFEG